MYNFFYMHTYRKSITRRDCVAATVAAAAAVSTPYAPVLYIYYYNYRYYCDIFLPVVKKAYTWAGLQLLRIEYEEKKKEERRR